MEDEIYFIGWGCSYIRRLPSPSLSNSSAAAPSLQATGHRSFPLPPTHWIRCHRRGIQLPLLYCPHDGTPWPCRPASRGRARGAAATAAAGSGKSLSPAFPVAQSVCLPKTRPHAPTAVSAAAAAAVHADCVEDRVSALSQVSGVLGSQWGDEGKGKLVDILPPIRRISSSHAHLPPLSHVSSLISPLTSLSDFWKQQQLQAAVATTGVEDDQVLLQRRRLRDARHLRHPAHRHGQDNNAVGYFVKQGMDHIQRLQTSLTSSRPRSTS